MITKIEKEPEFEVLHNPTRVMKSQVNRNFVLIRKS